MQLRPARRERLSDAETEERMLNAGLQSIAEQGLSLSLEHLQAERLIQAAGVSRTSYYRRWPTKGLFAADLLLRLAQATDLSGEIPGLAEALRAIPEPLVAGLDTAQGRRDIVVEVLRIVAESDFFAMLHSPGWRSYIALRAAHLGVPDGELRARVADALAATERRFTTRRTAAFQSLMHILGYRLRDPHTSDWDQLSLTIAAVSTGMLIRGYSDPEAVTTTVEDAAFDSSHAARWSPATRSLVGVVLGATEPDPAVTWDAERIAPLRAQLANAQQTMTDILAALPT
jgi:AcrR family transcriptional regulator